MPEWNGGRATINSQYIYEEEEEEKETMSKSSHSRVSERSENSEWLADAERSSFTHQATTDRHKEEER